MKELRKKDKELLQFVNSLADIFEKSKTPITETIIAVGRRDNNLINSILDKCATKIEKETYTENRAEDNLVEHIVNEIRKFV